MSVLHCVWAISGGKVAQNIRKWTSTEWYLQVLITLKVCKKPTIAFVFLHNGKSRYQNLPGNVLYLFLFRWCGTYPVIVNDKSLVTSFPWCFADERNSSLYQFVRWFWHHSAVLLVTFTCQNFGLLQPDTSQNETVVAAVNVCINSVTLVWAVVKETLLTTWIKYGLIVRSRILPYVYQSDPLHLLPINHSPFLCLP